MDRFFKLKANGTTVRTEIMAGLTTFMTMAYILAVNPQVLTDGTGLNWTAVFLATALAAGLITIAMGIFANFPVALAPGMALNAYFATVVITTAATGKPITAEMALTAVFISGIIFIILTVTQLRQLLIVAVPDSLKNAITVGIGLFIAIIGLKNSGLLTIGLDPIKDYASGKYMDIASFESIFHMGNLSDVNVQLTLVGLLFISILLVLRIKGAILYGILATTVVAIIVRNVKFDSLSSKDTTWLPHFGKLALFHFDFAGVMTTGLITMIATFTFVELFDTFGTLVGTANRAGLMKDTKEGKKLVGKAMLIDAIGVSAGAALGTSTVTAYVESAAGIAEGGRTGLTAVSTGVLFLISLFLAPIVALIPGSATSAALIVVGVLMVQTVRDIDFQDYVLAIPAFLTIVMMPFTYNIANGVSFGILAYVILATAANFVNKQKYKVHWLMWVLAALIVLRYATIGSVG